MSEIVPAPYDAGAAIDALLEADDGHLLAAMAWHKSAMVALVGKNGFTEMMKKAVENAKNVSYFSKRSRLEISPSRPTLRLRVDDDAAVEAHPWLAAQFRLGGPRGSDLGYGGDPRKNTVDKKAMQRITDFKSAVVFQEVCRPLTEELNRAIAPHWPEAKSHLVSLGANADLQRMLVSNIFAVGVSQGVQEHSRDKMVFLSALI